MFVVLHLIVGHLSAVLCGYGGLPNAGYKGVNYFRQDWTRSHDEMAVVREETKTPQRKLNHGQGCHLLGHAIASTVEKTNF